jgi:hypothetical protein
VNFAGGDFLGCCFVEAEFADTEAFVRAERRPEDAAGHRAGGVEVAESGGGIEGRAGLVVGEVVEVGGAVFVEEAGARVAGKIGSEASHGLAGAKAEAGGAFSVGRIEGGESITEAGSVELGDGEDADAALGASGSAFEPGSGAAGGVGDGGVDDLDQLRVAGGERHGVKDSGSGDEKVFIWERYAAGERGRSEKRVRSE